mgnify:CR=1 FL=1
MALQQTIKIVRKPEVLNTSGLSKTTLQNRINDGLMPPPIPLGDRAVGFLEFEVQAVLAAMAAGKNKDEIRAVVTTLVNQRQQAA